MTVLLFVFSALIQSSWSSPVDALSQPRLDKNPFLRRNSPNTCTSSYIQAAETRANKSLRQTISTLCSSLQGKYKTVTHSVYSKTVTPRTTIDTVTTAPRQTKTATRTSEITQYSTDIEASTSVVDVTATDIETLTVETDTVTITAHSVAVVVPRAQYPCQQIESLLTLPDKSATPFCSCYISGTTSTRTVTCDGVSTAQPVRVTDYTKTVTPTPSTAFTTIVQTTQATTTVDVGTVITDTVSVEETVSVT